MYIKHLLQEIFIKKKIITAKPVLPTEILTKMKTVEKTTNSLTPFTNSRAKYLRCFSTNEMSGRKGRLPARVREILIILKNIFN